MLNRTRPSLVLLFSLSMVLVGAFLSKTATPGTKVVLLRPYEWGLGRTYLCGATCCHIDSFGIVGLTNCKRR